MPWDSISMTFLLLTGILLMFIVLLQRGRGGGLAGAFGGAGGQSAFGTKAGDVFTKITVVIAVIWVVLAGASGFALRAGAERHGSEFEKPSVTATPGAEESDATKREEGEAAELPAKTEHGDDKPATEKAPEDKNQKEPEKGEPSENEKPANGNKAGGKAETSPGEGPKTSEKPVDKKVP